MTPSSAPTRPFGWQTAVEKQEAVEPEMGARMLVETCAMIAAKKGPAAVAVLIDDLGLPRTRLSAHTAIHMASRPLWAASLPRSSSPTA
jgi:hypothetical protein